MPSDPAATDRMHDWNGEARKRKGSLPGWATTPIRGSGSTSSRARSGRSRMRRRALRPKEPLARLQVVQDGDDDSLGAKVMILSFGCVAFQHWSQAVEFG